MQVKIEKTPVGVVIGRFQTPELHDGHRDLLKSVCERHKKVLILIGSTPGILVTKKNPMDFFTRKLMLQEYCPDAVILPISDMPSNEDWSKSVDEKIIDTFGDHQKATLYGSRDAFIPFYSGKYPTVELQDSFQISATEIRSQVSEEVRGNVEFRRGVCYAAHNRHSVAYPTVDIAIISNDKLILGRKKTDTLGKYRFPGGFVDPRNDKCLEDTAIREAREETGCEVGDPIYIGSTFINDWRYKNENDCIITSVFLCKYIFGSPSGMDDLQEAKFFPLVEDTKELIMPQHQNIFDLVISHLKKEKN